MKRIQITYIGYRGVDGYEHLEPVSVSWTTSKSARDILIDLREQGGMWSGWFEEVPSSSRFFIPMSAIIEIREVRSE